MKKNTVCLFCIALMATLVGCNEVKNLSVTPTDQTKAPNWAEWKTAVKKAAKLTDDRIMGLRMANSDGFRIESKKSVYDIVDSAMTQVDSSFHAFVQALTTGSIVAFFPNQKDGKNYIQVKFSFPNGTEIAVYFVEMATGFYFLCHDPHNKDQYAEVVYKGSLYRLPVVLDAGKTCVLKYDTNSLTIDVDLLQ